MNTKNSHENKNPKEFLTTLENLKSIPDYQNLGFTLNSLCTILKTALLNRMEADFNDYDLYNLISIIQSLLPNEELELLDLLNKR
ncbi:hypothetical protein [Apibacter adventoris]|uniref:Uncharacterized protein n=1 Tax=Apibacter adventoris TaxID=1679466 RepID=A0A2S8A4L7_9FLAO|nr:hypothetical protein [Apibacter adventoris]PQL89476.1 hypothetical protein C4S77_12610 [Apibacter adventoris]